MYSHRLLLLFLWFQNENCLLMTHVPDSEREDDVVTEAIPDANIPGE